MAKRKRSETALFAESDFPPNLADLAAKHLQAYSFEGPHKQGKTGATYRIRHRATNQIYCLKTIRPDKTDSAERKRISNTLKKECEVLAPLDHRCLPHIYQHAKFLDGYFYICTYHPGTPFSEWAFEKMTVRKLESTFIIRSLMDVIKYLHGRGRTHNDLHSNNVLLHSAIYEHGIMVVDFGSAHRYTDPAARTAMRGNVYVKSDDEKAKQNQLVNRADVDFEASDFRALGELLLETSDVFFADANAMVREAYKDFARSLFNRQIRGWDDADSAFENVIDPLRLVNANVDLFLSKGGRPQEIPLPVVHAAAVGEPSLKVINTKVFQRLRNLRQLSFCELFFPGAVHTRFEHSLGVFSNAKRIIEHLAHDRGFREVVSPAQARALLLASLIHDVGHYPFAHVLEQYAKSRLWRSTAAKQAADHERHTLWLLKNDTEFREAIVSGWGLKIFDIVESLLDKTRANKLVRSILDGPIDIDKIDYLRRDALHCGIKFGAGLDTETLMQSFAVVKARTAVGISDSGIAAAEGLMILQDQMLASVYWHPVPRGAICMLHTLLAYIIGDSEDKFIPFVKKIRDCRTEEQAVRTIIQPACEAEAKRRSKSGDPTSIARRLKELINFVVEPDFNSVYVPIDEFPRTERIEEELVTVYKALVMDLDLTAKKNEEPINWVQLKRLRQSYLTVLRDYVPQIDNMDIVIDVPYGKSEREMLKVLVRSTGDEEDLTDVSNLPASIFTAPAAFASPVRVYVSPRIIKKLKPSDQQEVRRAAKKQFFDVATQPEKSAD